VILAPAYHLIKYFGAIGLGITYFSSYLVLSIIFILYIKLKLKLRINRLVIHLGIGTVFPLSVFLINQYAKYLTGYLGLLVLFCILFVIELPKMIDISVINELFKDKLSRVFSKQ
jgi:O-antigen/teichoic acid export membrane protein